MRQLEIAAAAASQEADFLEIPSDAQRNNVSPHFRAAGACHGNNLIRWPISPRRATGSRHGYKI